MTTKQDNRAEISMLLPWYAAGTLSATETRRVADAIASDPELAARLEDIREEASETLLLNESLGVPSRAAADKLFAAIDAEQAANPRVYKPRFSFSSWLGEKLSLASPRTLAMAASAAALVIALQAGVLVGTIGGDTSTPGFETATAPNAVVTSGPQILVNFVPTATAADIETALKEAGGVIVDGPAAGIYRVRIGPSTLDKAGVERVVEMLRAKPEIVRFVAPAS